MLTVLRVEWRSVDDLRWSIIQSLLNTARLAPHGCLSWHSRRVGAHLRVTALWDDYHAAEIFVRGGLHEVVAAARLDPPTVSNVPLPGIFATGSRPRPAAPVMAAAPAADRSPRRVA